MRGDMRPFPRRARALSLAAVAVAAAHPAFVRSAHAAETETRSYEVRVGSDKVGASKLVITKQDDGSFLVKNEADVKVQILWVKVTYWLRAYEIWKGGTLQRLAANTYDDGDKRSVEVTPAGAGLKVAVNGKERSVAQPVWTTTFWTLPSPEARGENQRLLDTDSGKEKAGRLTFVGKESCTPAGRATTCRHYRVTSDEEIDVWFDDAERLVRRETTKMGKRVAVVLTAVTR